MKREFLRYLCDPITHASLQLDVWQEDKGRIMAGMLYGQHAWYPIINGVPRLLVRELRRECLRVHADFFNQYKTRLSKPVQLEWNEALAESAVTNSFVRHQKATGESFAYEWNTIYTENNYERDNFLHFLSPFIAEDAIRHQMVLDIGCGSGRFTKQAAACGAKLVFGLDVGESVELAAKLTADSHNTCIIQADVYVLPFYKAFDLAFSIGVLHHLPKPQRGFAQIPATLKIGGRLLIWVYNRRHNRRALWLYEPLRLITRKLPKPLLYQLCYIPGGIVHAINQITHLLNEIGARRLAAKIPFAYYANFPFNMKLNDAFDVLATPKSNYYYAEEVQAWFKNANLHDIEIFEHPEAGITCIGTI